MPAQLALNAEHAIEAALAARDTGQLQAGVNVLTAALRREPSNPRLWQTLAGLYRALEDSAAAIDAFARAAELAPGDVKPLHGVAQASLEAGRPATALFDRARELAPHDGSLLIGRAAAQLAEGQGGQAVIDLATVLSTNPTWLEGHATLSRLRWQMGDIEGFDASYPAALAATPRSRELWAAWATALVEVEAWERAAAVIARAELAAGSRPGFALLAAHCASELGDLADADRRFAQLPGQSVALAEYHARHLLRAGRADAAARLIELQLQSHHDGRLWPYAALAWQILGDARAQWLIRPELVGVEHIDLDFAAIAAFLRTRHHAMSEPAGQSVRGGTQTDGPLFALEAPVIRSLRAAVQDAVTRYLARLGPAEPDHPTLRHVGKPTRFAGSWSVRLAGAGHHSAHVHSQGWISSALYVSIPWQREMGPAPNGWLELGAPPTSLGLDLAPVNEIEPVIGRLVLFPSWMWHGTRPIAAGERLTVAFDVAAVG